MAQDAETQVKPEDDLPILADDAYEDEDQDVGEDDYDIISELEDDERHILDMLTDEEREALGVGDDDDGDPDPAEEDPDGEADEPAQPEDDAAATNETAYNRATEEDAPPQSADLSDDDISQIDADIKAQRAALREKWRDGDLTDQEFDDQDDALAASRESAIAAAREQKAQQAEEQAREALQSALIEEARALVAKHPDFLANGKEHLMGLDRHVRAVAESPRYAGMSAKDMMGAAMRLYVAEGEAMGFEVPGAADFAKPARPAARNKQQKAQQEAPKPKTAKPEPPKTLARVPAAATNSTVDGKWGALQHIMKTGTVDEQERAMASLSDEEREIFASMDIGD